MSKPEMSGGCPISNGGIGRVGADEQLTVRDQAEVVSAATAVAAVVVIVAAADREAGREHEDESGQQCKQA